MTHKLEVYLLYQDLHEGYKCSRELIILIDFHYRLQASLKLYCAYSLQIKWKEQSIIILQVAFIHTFGWNSNWKAAQGVFCLLICLPTLFAWDERWRIITHLQGLWKAWPSFECSKIKEAVGGDCMRCMWNLQKRAITAKYVQHVFLQNSFVRMHIK